MKLSFDFTSPSLVGTAFPIDDYVQGDSIPDRDALATHAIKWILNATEDAQPPLNKPFYNLPKERTENLLSLQNSVCLGLNEKISALSRFTLTFLNNPYVYEHLIEENSKFYLSTSWHILGYFVTYANIPIPIGALDKFWSEQVVNNIISAFMTDRNAIFKSLLSDNIKKCDDYLKTYDSEKKFKRKHKTHVFLTIAILLLVIPFIISRFILGISFSDIPYAVTASSNMFNFAGYITESSYGVNRNCILGFVCILLSLFWFFRIFPLISPLKSEIGAVFTYSKRIRIYKKAEKMLLRMSALSDEDLSRMEFIRANSDKLKGVLIRKASANFLPSCASELSSAKLPPDVKTLSLKLPSTAKLVFFLIFALLTFGLHTNLDKPETIDNANSFMQSTTTFFEERGFYASLKHTVKTPTVLYATSTRGSMPLYDIRPGDYFRIVESATESEPATKIRIFTEYGYLNGWVFDAKFASYTPNNDPSLFTAPVALSSTNSKDAGNLKTLFDGSSLTRWVAGGNNGGIGECVDMRLDNTYPIKGFMIQSGNCYSDWLFNVSSRPNIFTLEFFTYDEQEKTSTLVDSIKVQIDNTQYKQYIHFNKAVSANYVRLTIDDVIVGKVYPKACITEFALYSANTDS